jgi:hypothetical protein
LNSIPSYICACICVCIYECLAVYVCVFQCAWASMCVYVCVCVFACVSIRACVWVCVCFTVSESESRCVDSSPFRIIPSHLTSKIANAHRMKSQAVSAACYAACPFWVCLCHHDTTADENTTLFSVLTLRIVSHDSLYKSRTRQVKAHYVGILNKKSTNKKEQWQTVLCFTAQRRIYICNKTYRNQRGMQNSIKGFGKKFLFLFRINLHSCLMPTVLEDF